jgi:hypothetical protein
MNNIYLEKANRTIKGHAWGYANTWGLTHPMHKDNPLRTGDFSKDYNCYPDVLAKAFEEEDCPICVRSYASMAEGKKGVASNPLWHKSLHIWYPDWIVVCRSCHPRLEGKLAKEWEAYKRQHFNQPELKLKIDN